jgi:hypothetical protein
MTALKTLYDEDTVAWSEQQAAALRAAARGGSNQELDWENLAEEIESLGKSLRLGLRSQISRIIQRHVKLGYSPAADPRNSWRRLIHQARAEIERILEDSPSLKPEGDGQSSSQSSICRYMTRSTGWSYPPSGGRATPKRRCSATGSRKSRAASVQTT